MSVEFETTSLRDDLVGVGRLSQLRRALGALRPAQGRDSDDLLGELARAVDDTVATVAEIEVWLAGQRQPNLRLVEAPGESWAGDAVVMPPVGSARDEA